MNSFRLPMLLSGSVSSTNLADLQSASQVTHCADLIDLLIVIEQRSSF